MPVRVGSRPVAFRSPVTSSSNVESVVEQDEAMWTIARKHVPQLLHHPRGRRLTGHVEVEDLPPSVFDDEEAREQLERRRRDGEEIASDDCLSVVGEARRTSGAGIAAAWEASQISCDAAFGDVEAELHQFPVDSGRTPTRILRREPADEEPNLFADPRAAPAMARSPPPVEAKAGSMPPDDGLPFPDEQHV